MLSIIAYMYMHGISYDEILHNNNNLTGIYCQYVLKDFSGAGGHYSYWPYTCLTENTCL